MSFGGLATTGTLSPWETTIEGVSTARAACAPVTPGEMLREEFRVEYGLSQTQLATASGISPNRLAELVNNRRRITADPTLRLGLFFGNSPESEMNLPAHSDRKLARQNLRPDDAQGIQGREGQ